VGVGETGAGGSSGSRRKRFRSGLLVAQLALTVPLVATCAIAYVNLVNLQNTDFGFSVQRLLTARVELPPYRYPVDQQASFFREALEAVRGVPDVVSASAGMGVPIGAGWEVSRGDFLVPGREDLEAGERGPRAFQAVVPGYFETLGVSFRGGRGFNDADGPDDPPVAVVNEALARRYWPDEDAIGQVLLPDPEGRPGDPGTASAPELPLTVVGVVSDFGASFRGDPPSPMLYLPQAQRPGSSLVLVARTRGDPLLTVSAVRAAVRRVDPDVPVSAFETGEAMVDRWLRESRTTGVALGVLALLALGLAVIGLYGMVAYSVSRRTFELGVRMVLGADRWAIRLSVMRYFLVLAALGLSIGLVLSVAVGMVARPLLVMLQVSFVQVTVGLTAVLMGVVLLASYVPARRATGIEPVIALKSE